MLSIAKLYPTRQWFRTYPLIGNVRSSRWTDPMLKAEFEELIQQILKNHPDVTREEAEMLVLTGGGVRPRAVYEPTPELRGRREIPRCNPSHLARAGRRNRRFSASQNFAPPGDRRDFPFGGEPCARKRQPPRSWDHLIPITMLSAPASGSTRALENPASRIQPIQSDPV